MHNIFDLSTRTYTQIATNRIDTLSCCLTCTILRISSNTFHTFVYICNLLSSKIMRKWLAVFRGKTNAGYLLSTANKAAISKFLHQHIKRKAHTDKIPHECIFLHPKPAKYFYEKFSITSQPFYSSSNEIINALNNLIIFQDLFTL